MRGRCCRIWKGRLKKKTSGTILCVCMSKWFGVVDVLDNALGGQDSGVVLYMIFNCNGGSLWLNL